MKLHFRKLGEGPPVVILHGLLGSSDNWQTFGKMLAAASYSVYMVDLRNHGHSPHDPVFDFPEMVEDILQLFDDENLDSAFLIGHSLGGKTAMEFAYHYPRRLKGLIVIDIAPRYYPVHHQKILDALKKVPVGTITSRKEVEDILNQNIDDNGMVQF